MHTAQTRTAIGFLAAWSLAPPAWSSFLGSMRSRGWRDGESFVVAQVSGPSLDAGAPASTDAGRSALVHGDRRATGRAARRQLLPRVDDHGGIEVSSRASSVGGPGCRREHQGRQIVRRAQRADGGSYMSPATPTRPRDGAPGLGREAVVILLLLTARGGGRCVTSSWHRAANARCYRAAQRQRRRPMWTRARSRTNCTSPRASRSRTRTDTNGVLSFGATDETQPGSRSI